MAVEIAEVEDARFALVMSAMGGLFTANEQEAYDRLCDLLDEIDRVGQPEGAP